MLKAAGRWADRALLWAVPSSDLARSAALISAGARDRQLNGQRPEVVWAPLVDHGGQSRQRVQTIAAYSVLNSQKDIQARWGLDQSTIARLREVLVGGGAAAAQNMVPVSALDDLIIQDPSPTRIGTVAKQLGATSIAVPAFSIEEIQERVAWARKVLA
jgi:riboflavin biosynthesis pyrimidine reductase